MISMFERCFIGRPSFRISIARIHAIKPYLDCLSLMNIIKNELVLNGPGLSDSSFYSNLAAVMPCKIAADPCPVPLRVS
jgi:hypothetical protein